jgi:hypothetical protein
MLIASHPEYAEPSRDNFNMCFFSQSFRAVMCPTYQYTRNNLSITKIIFYQRNLTFVFLLNKFDSLIDLHTKTPCLWVKQCHLLGGEMFSAVLGLALLVLKLVVPCNTVVCFRLLPTYETTVFKKISLLICLKLTKLT